jgi:hypothetical protein
MDDKSAPAGMRATFVKGSAFTVIEVTCAEAAVAAIASVPASARTMEFVFFIFVPSLFF